VDAALRLLGIVESSAYRSSPAECKCLALWACVWFEIGGGWQHTISRPMGGGVARVGAFWDGACEKRLDCYQEHGYRRVNNVCRLQGAGHIHEASVGRRLGNE
jgi:hypothetical protein